MAIVYVGIPIGCNPRGCTQSSGVDHKHGVRDYSAGAPVTDIHPSRGKGTPIKQGAGVSIGGGGDVRDRGVAAETGGAPINNRPTHRYPTVTR
nr:MAG TPA: hypothetical protein [Bacteriophage sp.]